MSTERENQMRWDQSISGHHEKWFCSFNHPATNTGYRISYTVTAPTHGQGETYAQLWFARFDEKQPHRNIAVNKRFPIAEMHVTRDPFHLAIADSSLSHGALKGSLRGDGHEIEWDIGFAPSLFVHRHLPDFLYRMDIADATILSPNPTVHMHGHVTIDGRKTNFSGAPGCQTHVWGRKLPYAHALGHCGAFREDPTACLEVVTVQLARFRPLLPRLTFLSLYLGSEVYHFRRLGTLLRTRGGWDTGLFRFGGVGHRVKVEGELRCSPEDLIQANHVDPDGEASFCSATLVADATVAVHTRRSRTSRFKRRYRLTALGCAHFEHAGRKPNPRVVRRHNLVP